ncbi:hypothetical protein KIW84_052732 [Lathyrus oleraceus]|uniref:Uncharacterized protein n=1 Tax=Pisum sativum TaxID=3888 RepID=A0A9D4WNE6_PEA|nr:hypothetical protein KIW84_052732 [Pisum sativum]
MYGHEYLFKEMQKIEDGHVSLGDASKVKVEGKGHARASDCSSRNGKKSNVQTEFEKRPRKMFASQCRRQSVVVAFTFLSSTSYWSEKVSEEEHSARAGRHGL